MVEVLVASAWIALATVNEPVDTTPVSSQATPLGYTISLVLAAALNPRDRRPQRPTVGGLLQDAVNDLHPPTQH